MELRIVLERNPSILLEERRTRSLLNDVYQNDAGKVNVLMAAYGLGILRSARREYPIDSFEKARFEKLLVTQFAMQPAGASWAVSAWMTAISPAVLRGLEAAEAQQEAEQKKRAKEPKKGLEKTPAPRASDLLVREDYERLHVNPVPDENKESIRIPCGVGRTDNGFEIRGIRKCWLCNHPSADLYALVYNYLIRSTEIGEKDIPRFIRESDAPFVPDYRSVFRMAMIVLMLIRHNVLQGCTLSANVQSREERESLRLAVAMINLYTALFGRLSRLKAEPLQLRFAKEGLSLSLTGTTDVYVVDQTGAPGIARELWYGRRIRYRLDGSSKADLLYILSEISPFDSFREGQLDALFSMLAADGDAVCIMPTGSGKSLIYYLASLLQPLPMIVVVPTEILIEDQVRNLKKFHHMDNAAHLMLTEKNSFWEYDLCCQINYVTPMTLRNRNLHVKCRYFNEGTKLVGMHTERIAPGPLLSYVVLDEVHCISNWGHDFRPEYLMLSGFLKKFLDRVILWGFTATANYTVVEDIQKQLEIPDENFFSPVAFEKYNVSYQYLAYRTEEEMYAALSEITAGLIAKKQRTLVFTKNDDVSRRAAEAIGYEADIFSEDMPDAYRHFADGKCTVLVASDILGIGINLPNVRNVIHFGLPLSKSEYVQQIGRAGRADETVISYVLYLENTPANVPERALRRDTPMEEISALQADAANDYGDVYRRLTNGCPAGEALCDQLVSMYRLYEKEVQPEAVRTFTFNSLEENKRLLYMLYAVGFLRDWYTYGTVREEREVDILIDIDSAAYDEYLKDPQKLFRRMQTKLRDYFDYMNGSREEAGRVNRARTPEELIRVYADWYFRKYLFQHNEMFLDLFELIDGNHGQGAGDITSLIRDFFTLPFMKLKTEEARFGGMDMKEIVNKVVSGMDRSCLADLERINGNRYSVRLDALLFCAYLRYNDRFEGSRLARILDKASKEERDDLRAGMRKLYGVCGVRGKLQILRYLDSDANGLQLDREEFLKAAYARGEKDMIYYGLMAERLNPLFGMMGREMYV